MAPVKLYHPALKTTIEVPTERSAQIHKAAGWVDASKVSASGPSGEPSPAPASTEGSKKP